MGFENVLVAGRNKAEHARQALLLVLTGPGRPSALFAVTQTMTVGALQSVWEAGLELPKNVSLLAFDDSEWFTALKPFVSTLRQPTDDFAHGQTPPLRLFCTQQTEAQALAWAS